MSVDHVAMPMQLLAFLLTLAGWTAIALTQRRPLARLTGNGTAIPDDRRVRAVRLTGAVSIALASLIWIGLDGWGFGSLMALLATTFAACGVSAGIAIRWQPLRHLAQRMVAQSG